MIAPTNENAVASAITAAADAREPIEIIGAGSKRALGGLVRSKRQLTVAGLRGITLYEPAELVLSARAGTLLNDIEAALAANHQCLAFEPPDLGNLLGIGADGQTIGGIVATNLAGPRRCTAGAVRDHVLGVRAVNGRGEIFKAGGRVVKNVTGYDLCKLLTGSWGTLAVLTEVTLKVLPAPETEETVVAAGLPADRAVSLMAEALGSPVNPTAAAWLPDHLAATTAARSAGASVTCLRLEGFSPSIAARRARLQDMIHRSAESWILAEDESRLLWRQVRNVAPLTGNGGDAVWKISVPPREGPGVVERLSQLGGSDAFLDWAGGLIWLRLPCGADGQAAAVRAALPADGHATLIAAPEHVRAEQAVFQPPALAVAGPAARIKAQFDPKGVLNPGRMTPSC